MAVKELLILLNDAGYYIQEYADDIVMLTYDEHHNVITMAENLWRGIKYGGKVVKERESPVPFTRKIYNYAD